MVTKAPGCFSIVLRYAISASRLTSSKSTLPYLFFLYEYSMYYIKKIFFLNSMFNTPANKMV